jgi:hypothetical protein
LHISKVYTFVQFLFFIQLVHIFFFELIVLITRASSGTLYVNRFPLNWLYWSRELPVVLCMWTDFLLIDCTDHASFQWYFVCEQISSISNGLQDNLHWKGPSGAKFEILYFIIFLPIWMFFVFLYPPQRSCRGYTGFTMSVRL